MNLEPPGGWCFGNEPRFNIRAVAESNQFPGSIVPPGGINQYLKLVMVMLQKSIPNRFGFQSSEFRSSGLSV